MPKETYQQKVLKTALEYYDKGYCVIPLNYGSKVARLPWRKYQFERPTREEVETWFSDGLDHNIGVVCGAVSGGLVVLVFNDVDDLAHFSGTKEQVEKFSKCPLVQTYRGYHLYIENIEEIMASRIYAGGRFEIKSDGTYVVAPPSLHPEGVNYKWLRSTVLP